LKRTKSPSFIQEFELLEPKRGGFKQIDQVEDFSRRLFNAVLGKLKRKSSRPSLPKNGIKQENFQKEVPLDMRLSRQF
jgi:hypothetical protein